MKTSFLTPLVLLAGTILLSTAPTGEARRFYGVSGDRGYAFASRRGVAWSGEYSSGAVGRRGGVVATDNGVAASGRYGAVVAGDRGLVVARRSYGYGTILPAGYFRVIPPGYTIVAHAGYNCYYAGGVYYRAVFYGGETLYVIVP